MTSQATTATAALRRSADHIPFVRGLVHLSPQYFTGSVIENRCGLQVFKVIGKRAAWHLRKARHAPEFADHIRTMQRDGVLVIPDFLTAEAFSEVRAEFERIKAEMRFKQHGNVAEGLLNDAHVYFDSEGAKYPAIKKHLQQSGLIRAVAAAVMRRDPGAGPNGAVSVFQRNPSATAELDNDTENQLHADLHTSTVKVFFYLNDIDAGNGALIYAKGSHKVTLARLRHEYLIGVHTAKLKRGDHNIPEELLVHRGEHRRVIISARHQQAMNLKETQIAGRANTLVIADMMGMHRRGEFTEDAPRETVMLNFRHLEKCFF